MSTQELVELITRQVIGQLQAARNNGSIDASNVAADEIAMNDAVVTEALLEKRANDGKAIRFADSTVLTPSARDYLRQHNIAWTTGRAGVVQNTWAAILVHSSPAFETVLSAHSIPFNSAGCLDSAIDLAIAETANRGIVLATDSPCVAACKANRLAHVRAASVMTAKYCHQLTKAMAPNLWCLDPRRRSHSELRNILQVIVKSGSPTLPADWKEASR